MAELSEIEKAQAVIQALIAQGRYQEAVKPLTELIGLSKGKDGNSYGTGSYGISLQLLGNVYYKLGEFKLALSYCQRALAIFEKRKSRYLTTAVLYNDVSAIYCSLNDSQSALEYGFRALKLFEKSSDNTRIANAYVNIASAYNLSAYYNEALRYLLRAMKVYEHTAGPSNADSCLALINIGALYGVVEDLPKAIKYSKQALALSEREHKENCLNHIMACIGLGSNYAKNADYDNSLKYLYQALELLKKALGLNHYLAAECYDNLSEIFSDKRDYQQALDFRHKSIAVVKKTKGETHYDMAYQYIRLSIIYQKTCDYDRALEYLNAALKIRKDVLTADEHQDIAEIYCLLGNLYLSMSKYPEALIYGFRALRIREKVLRADHPDVGLSFKEISRIYDRLRDYPKSLDYQERALKIYLKAYGADSPKTAELYNELGTTYDALSDNEKALEYQIRALTIDEKKLAAEHPSIAFICCDIAYSYDNQHNPLKAIQYNFRALDIMEKVFGPEHPNVFPIWNLFGRIYYEMGKFQEALQCCNHLLDIQLKAYDYEQPAFIDTYAHITLLHYEQQNADMIIYAKKLMEAIVRGNFSVFYIPQEKLRLNLLNNRRKAASLCFSVVFSEAAQFNESDLYAFELGTKNLVAEASFMQSSMASRDKTSEYAEKYSALKGLQNLYAKYSLEGFPKSLKREDLERQILDGEIALAPYYRTIDFKLHMQQATPGAVQKKLPDHAALLEYGRYYHFSKEPVTQEQTGAGERYFVFIVRKDSIRLFELGDNRKIDELIEQVRLQLTKKEDVGEILNSLYRCLIGPVENELKEIRQLFIAPDSELFKSPFELLTNDSGEWLSQRIPAISYVSTGRDILRFSGKAAAEPSHNITIIANPEFNLDDREIQLSGNNKDEDRGFDGHLRAENIHNIPFTAMETDLIAGLFDSETATVLSGSRATKSTIKRFNSPSVMHLSTHGFAFPPQDEDVPQKAELFGHTNRGSRVEKARNPMLRCGLLFAGIRNWLDGATLPEEIGNGILNGLDVLTLDLSGTDLMVLSACQTGLGDIQTGEGIQGLRRAFELVGVHTLISTLWEVDDLASAILMTAFYKNLLKNSLSKAAALAAAKEYTRTVTPKQLLLDGWDVYIDKLMNKGFMKQAIQLKNILDGEFGPTPFAHPYFWAGFVLQGEG